MIDAMVTRKSGPGSRSQTVGVNVSPEDEEKIRKRIEKRLQEKAHGRR